MIDNMTDMTNMNAVVGKCIPQEMVIENIKLAHAYVPIQKMCEVFDHPVALMNGTVFPPLWDNYNKGKRGMMIDDE